MATKKILSGAEWRKLAKERQRQGQSVAELDRATMCENCKSLEAVTQGLCHGCFDKLSHSCAQCQQVRILPPAAVCADCQAQGVPCLACQQELTTHPSHICRTCYDAKKFACTTCSTPIAQPGMCKTCWHEAQGHVQCETCGTGWTKHTSGRCLECYRAEKMKCKACQTNNAPRAGLLCTQCWQAKKEQEEAGPTRPRPRGPVQCSFSWQQDGKEHFCTATTTRGKFCHDCFELVRART